MPTKKKAKAKPKSTPLENIASPVTQALYDRDEEIAKAIAALDEALTAEEEAHAPDLLEVRTFFQSFKYSEPFRYLIGLAAKK